jgi:heme A synthase
MRGHPGVEYVALGIFLTVDGMLWRDALRVPPTRRRGQVAAAILGLVLVVGTLLDLLVPF